VPQHTLPGQHIDNYDIFNPLDQNQNPTPEPDDGMPASGANENPVDPMEIWEEGIPGVYVEDTEMVIPEEDGGFIFQDLSGIDGDTSVPGGKYNDQDWEDESICDYEDLNPSSNGDANFYEEFYEGAAQVQTCGAAPFYTMLEEQQRIGQKNHYYPFAGAKEWELACWLHSSGLSRRHIDSFIKLKFVSPYDLPPETLWADFLPVQGYATLVSKWSSTGRSN
jgi:hypothetical protein